MEYKGRTKVPWQRPARSGDQSIRYSGAAPRWKDEINDLFFHEEDGQQNRMQVSQNVIKIRDSFKSLTNKKVDNLLHRIHSNLEHFMKKTKYPIKFEEPQDHQTAQLLPIRRQTKIFNPRLMQQELLKQPHPFTTGTSNQNKEAILALARLSAKAEQPQHFRVSDQIVKPHTNRNQYCSRAKQKHNLSRRFLSTQG